MIAPHAAARLPRRYINRSFSLIGQQHDDRGADERAGDVARAADHHHEHEEDRQQGQHLVELEHPHGELDLLPEAAGADDQIQVRRV